MTRPGRVNHPKIKREEGVVLIAVLWICALVMWFTLQIGLIGRLQGEEQIHLFRRSQALYLAIGGCFEALARMGQPPPTGFERGPDLSWQPDGAPHLLEYQTGQVQVSVESEIRKVNVNSASPDQLGEILVSAGVDKNFAGELADVIADFRDPGDVPRLHGLKAAGYKRLGLPYGPFNGPLLTLDQMLLIPGITEELLYGYRRRDSGTEEGGSPASSTTMLPTKDSLFQMLSIYGTGIFLPQTDLNQELEGKILTWENGGIYRIFSTGIAYNGPPAVTICLIVRFTPGSKLGYDVLYRKIL